MPAARNAAQAPDEIGRAEPRERLRALRGLDLRHARGVLRRGLRLGVLARLDGLLGREQHAPEIALEQFRREARFLGRAIREAPALAVATQIERVEMEALADLHA